MGVHALFVSGGLSFIGVSVSWMYESCLSYVYVGCWCPQIGSGGGCEFIGDCRSVGQNNTNTNNNYYNNNYNNYNNYTRVIIIIIILTKIKITYQNQLQNLEE